MPVGIGRQSRRRVSPAMREMVSTTPRYCGCRPPERTAFRRLVSRCAISTASARRGRAVVHGGVGDLHAGQVRDLRLELEQVLQRALRDLRLIGRVGGQELGALDQVIDARRDVVAVGAGADEERHRAGGDVPRRHRAEDALDLDLALGRRQIEEAGEALVGGNVGEEIVDRGTPMRASIAARSSSVWGR